jgi:membrane protein
MLEVLKETWSDWNEDKAPRLAAALAYYTAFSLAPLLVIAIAIAGLVFGQEAARGQVSSQIQGLLGPEGAEAVETMIAGSSKQSSGILAAVIGFATLLFGASGLFGQLKDAMNTIWEVQPKPGQGIMATIKQNFFSFTMVLGTGFLLLVSLLLSAVLAGLVGFFQNALPGADWLWLVVNFLVGFAVTTGVFALIFKFVPDAKIAWGDVWIGAAVTSLLFSIGRFALGWYLGNGSFSSSYGAAASLVIVLLWVYYTAQILFFGAEFTQVYARRYGSRIEPAPNAVRVTEEERAQQGMPSPERLADAARRNGDSPLPVREREVGGSPGTVPPAEPVGRPGVLAVAVGFLVGLVTGRKNAR